MYIKFTKMHGLGNDFMVVDLISQRAHLRPDQIKRLADRHFGVGFDQLLLIEPPGRSDVVFRYRIFNADGSEVEQCGNGARCFARFIYDNRMTPKSRIKVETKKGIIELIIEDNGLITVDMGAPRLDPEEIPFQAESRASVYPIEVDGKTYEISAVSLGNPHGVLVVPDVSRAPVQALGRRLETHPRFPERANIGFMQVINPRLIKLRVFERGVGETLACGTGACVAVVAGRLQGLLEERVEVRLPGGSLQIHWPGEGQSVRMTGPATRVFEGEVRV